MDEKNIHTNAAFVLLKNAEEKLVCVEDEWAYIEYTMSRDGHITLVIVKLPVTAAEILVYMTALDPSGQIISTSVFVILSLPPVKLNPLFESTGIRL